VRMGRVEAASHYTIGIHVCAKCIHCVDTIWMFHGHDEADDGAVAPADKGSFSELQSIRNGENIGLHQFVG